MAYSNRQVPRRTIAPFQLQRPYNQNVVRRIATGSVSTPGQYGELPTFTVLCASTANVATLDTSTTTLDGVTLIAGEYVLLIAQTDDTENGIWRIPGTGATTTDWVQVDIYGGQLVVARLGDTHGGRTFKVLTDGKEIEEGTDAVTIQAVNPLDDNTLFVSPNFEGLPEPYFSTINDAKSYVNSESLSCIMVLLPGVYEESLDVDLRADRIKQVHYVDATTIDVGYRFRGSYGDVVLSLTGTGRVTGSCNIEFKDGYLQSSGKYTQYYIDINEIDVEVGYTEAALAGGSNNYDLSLNCGRMRSSVGSGYSQSGAAVAHVNIGELYVTMNAIGIYNGDFYGNIGTIEVQRGFGLRCNGANAMCVVDANKITAANTIGGACVSNYNGVLYVDSNVILAESGLALSIVGGHETIINAKKIVSESNGDVVYTFNTSGSVVEIWNATIENMWNKSFADGVVLDGALGTVTLNNVKINLAHSRAEAVKVDAGATGTAIMYSSGLQTEGTIDASIEIRGDYLNSNGINVGGGLSHSINHFDLTADRTLTTDYVVWVADSITSTWTVTLPPAADCPGQVFQLWGEGTGLLAGVQGDGSDTINKSAGVKSWGENKPVMLISDGVDDWLGIWGRIL